MYNTLSNSYIWSTFNATPIIPNGTSGGAVIRRINNFIKSGRVINFVDEMPTVYLKLKNRLKSPITSKYLEYIKSGDIKLIYNPDVRIPTYLPFFTLQMEPNSYTGFIPINNLSPVVTENEITLNVERLKVAVETCYITMKIFDLGENTKLLSVPIIRNGSKIYSSIVSTCLDRKHSIRLSVNIYNTIIFLCSKFFVGTILGLFKKTQNITNDKMAEINNYCFYNCTDPDIRFIGKIDDQFNFEDYNNIATFINKLASIPELQVRLKNLTVDNFIEAYIRIYNASMLLSLEVFQYFLFNVISVVDQTYVNEFPILKNLVGDEGKKLYIETLVTFCDADK